MLEDFQAGDFVTTYLHYGREEIGHGLILKIQALPDRENSIYTLLLKDQIVHRKANQMRKTSEGESESR
jgi:hypothetical protein